ncbi:MAG TPA: hypothetical protein VLQ29_10990 [Candidatus Dormibacteraeota bacterium]|nr:hypothetical protein [Candidatus Dormibacteraeota bacterium]
MKPKQIFHSILAVLFVFPLMGAFAQKAANSGSIEVITTFDYPGTGIVTTSPQKINERGDIVGEFIDSNGVVRGFVRFSNGTFSDPIVDPNDTVGFTEGRGINNPRTVVGDYVISDGTVHSFLLSGGTFTEYDVPGALQTNLLSINEPGDLTGTFDPGNGVFEAFIDRGGTITSYSVPGAAATLAYEINNSKKLTVGYFVDASGILHGQYRDANGALHFPIDPSGSVGTVLFGLNNRNWVVGRYADAAGVTHGLFFVPPDSFFTFDFPGSAFTSLNGISSQGFITGRFVDASGIAHGIIARVRGTPPTTPAGPVMKANDSRSPVTPLDLSPSAWAGAMPAR